MTTLVAQVFEEETTISKDANDNISTHHCRNALRTKVRKIKPKCYRILKRKFKKYKLRQDGQEDQDILDVSGIFESLLHIKSPNELKTIAQLELEQFRTPNYLFKMGKRKQGATSLDKTVKLDKIISNINIEESSPTTEIKKQTNAFTLLMDSRSKSMGRNSPGKEKSFEETEKQELIEKSNNKAKRTLLLQKMAESKGLIKNKECEENQTKIINKKMEKRAERLKTLISNIEPKGPIKVKTPKTKSLRNPLNDIKTEKNVEYSDKTVKTLQLVNMFTNVESKMDKEQEKFSKEDVEFLNKLSPSLKKKESMLSYFKKVDNEPVCSIMNGENENTVIKVKLRTKTKKKLKKKRLSLARDIVNIDMKPEELDEKEVAVEVVTVSVTDTKIAEETSKERKRKRQSKSTFCDDAAVSSSNILTSRSKRNGKKPVRYNEDAAINSSDDELHVFTPKKKKRNKTSENDTLIVDLTPDVLETKEPLKKRERDELKSKSKNKLSLKHQGKPQNSQKPVKLAPIFASKSQIDPVANEAKQKFLHSGVPDQLKKIMSKQIDKNIVSNNFTKVVHIQQLNSSNKIESIIQNFEEYTSFEEQDSNTGHNFTIKMLLSMESLPEIALPSIKQNNPQTILQCLKEKHPRYPVYRTYRLLRGKKKGDYKVGINYLDLDNSVEINASIDCQYDNPEQLSWSDKYKPQAASQIIGNFESVKELRKWLVSWTESDMKNKMAQEIDSDSSDFCHDDDSKDSVKSCNNLLVLSGPVGSGKTSSVYAIAAELSIKVIEVNASSKRTGKIMLQDLQEATQSHKVNRQTSSNENSQNSQKSEIFTQTPSEPVKKRGRPKKNVETAVQQKQVPQNKITKTKKFYEMSESANGLSASQDSVRTCMSLILIDDADIVFDQDDGFCSAIVQLVQSSKRPVILITSSLACPHLQRFVQSSKILKLNPLLPNVLGTWLDIMCLADSGICWPGIGSKILNLFKGDVRKTVNCLQFYVCSQEQVVNQNTEMCSESSECRLNVDEASNMSWADHEHEEKNDEPSEVSNYFKSLMHQQSISWQHRDSNGLFNIWWNVPKLLNITDLKTSESIPDNITKNKTKSIDSLNKVLDAISLCDMFNHKFGSNQGTLSSEPWFPQESHSVSELENYESYDRHYGTCNEIAYDLAYGSISIAQEDFGCKKNMDFDLPGMSEQRHRDKIVSRHNTLASFLSPQATLDRKALALDYWPSCRTICRIEKSKTDSNSKRHNRFCHYLKSLGVLCKNDSFDKLTYSLCSSEKDTVNFTE